MSIHKTLSAFFLITCFQWNYASANATLDDTSPTARERTSFTFSNVKSYKRSEYQLKDAKTDTYTTVVNRDFIGTVKVDRPIDFIKIDVNLFDKNGIFIDKCTHQEYSTISPTKEFYFLVSCYNLPSEVEKEYHHHRIEAVSSNPNVSPTNSTALETKASTNVSPSDSKVVPKPKFTLKNLKAYPAQKNEENCSSLYREFVGTVEVNQQVEFISLNADLYDKKGIFLYRCDTQIHDGIIPKSEINFSISCQSLPPGVNARYHHYKVNAY